MPARVEGPPDGAHLAVHHAGRRHPVGAGLGVRDRDPRVRVERRIVVDRAAPDHAAVPVVRVLAQAQVGDEDQGFPELGAHGAEGLLHDPARIPGAAPLGVLVRRDPEQHDRGDAELRQRSAGLDEASDRMLVLPGHGVDLHGAGQALLDEERGDEIARVQPGLPHHLPKPAGASEPPEALLWEPHRSASYGPVADMVRPSASRSAATIPGIV